MSPRLSIIFSLLIISSNVWCEDLSLDTQTTENGISRFCKSGTDKSHAQKIIENINDKIKTKINNAKDITTQIDNLNAQKNILDGLTKLKDQYLNSLKNISDEEKGSIDQFKMLLRTSINLSAVSMLINNLPKEDDKKTVSSIENLCNLEANKKAPLCTYLFRFYNRNEAIKNIDQTLENFRDSYNRTEGEQKTELDQQLKAFDASMKSMETISPDKTIDILSQSKTFIPALANANDRETIIKCLKDDVQSCTNLMSKSSNRDSFVSAINSEIKDLRNNFGTEKYNDFFKKYDSNNSSGKKFQALIEDISNKSKNLPSSGKNSLNLDSDLVKNFDLYCNNKNEATFNIDKCLQNNQALVDNIKSSTDKNEAELKKLNEQLATVLNKDGSLEALEKMKKYIGDKYFRSCPNANTSSVDESVKGVCSAFYTDAPENSMNLSGKISEIVGKLSTANGITTTRGELGAFSKQELNTYSDYCQNSSMTKDDLLLAICTDINKEYNRIAKQKEAKEWDEFYNNYWVEYNPRSKKGYDVYEKKSNLRIVGEGVSQSIGKIYPIWMNNQQLKYQVDYMTNQALYQKQLNYMYSYGSPWMNYSYFQGAYFNSNFNTSNPFLWSTGTTGTTTSTIVPKTGGFSF